MPNRPFPFAVSLLGFSQQEEEAFDNAFLTEQGKGYGYVRLAEGNLQDPDFYIANGHNLKALVALVNVYPSDVRPALLIGTPEVDLPYACVAYPIDWPELFAALDELVERRADALSKLEASDIIFVPERRRQGRLDIDLTDPAEYAYARAAVPANGAVLIVDRNPIFRDYLARLLQRQNVEVLWTNDEHTAFALCNQQPIAVAMINTSTPTVHPYRLCKLINTKNTIAKTTAIFLVSKSFSYDTAQAQDAGVYGFLHKPLAGHHLLRVLRKFLPFLR